MVRDRVTPAKKLTKPLLNPRHSCFHSAREKTSQAFRDALHERYKSSNVAKKKRRQEEQAKASDKFRRIARSYSDGIGSRLEWLSLTDDGSGGAGAGFNMGELYVACFSFSSLVGSSAEFPLCSAIHFPSILFF